jgi:dTDP-4-amino-4,6-dideoxygalactose transaminase
MNKNILFCGQPAGRLKDVLGPAPDKHPIDSWFWPAERYNFHKARIGIRHACDLMSVRPGDEVLAPAYYCGSEIDPLLKAGARVSLYRVDKACMIDIEDLRKRITARTKAVYVTHFYGFPQDIETIKAICTERRLFLLEDCALALFSENGNKKLGTTGDMAVFSLTKALPVPDGGVLIVNNKSLDRLAIQWQAPDQAIILRRLLPFLKTNVLVQLSGQPALKLLYSKLFSLLNNPRIKACEKELLESGLSLIRPDMYYDDQKMNARAMSLKTEGMLGAFQPGEIRGIRRRNYSILAGMLRDSKSLAILFPDLSEGVCPLNLPILVEKRDTLQIEMYKRGIDAGAFWKGYHETFPLKDFPEAQYLKDHVLVLPIHQELDERQVRYIANTLLDILEGR